MKRRKLPSALTYWKDWKIGKKGFGFLVIFEPETEEIPDPPTGTVVEAIDWYFQLIEEDLFNVHREPFPNFLAATMYGLGNLARRGNEEALKGVDRLTEGLNRAIKGGGGRQGYKKPEDLKETIRGDIGIFRHILEEKQKSPKRSVDNIIASIANGTNPGFVAKSSERMWEVYNAYNEDCNNVLEVLPDWTWEDFCNFLECCREHVDQFVGIIDYKEDYFFGREDLRWRPKKKNPSNVTSPS